VCLLWLHSLCVACLCVCALVKFDGCAFNCLSKMCPAAAPAPVLPPALAVIVSGCARSPADNETLCGDASVSVSGYRAFKVCVYIHLCVRASWLLLRVQEFAHTSVCCLCVFVCGVKMCAFCECATGEHLHVFSLWLPLVVTCVCKCVAVS